MSPAGHPGPPAPGPAAASPLGRSLRPPLVLVYAITVTGILGNTLINASIPDILDDLAIDDTRAGLLVAAASIPGIAMAPLIGLLADRYGRRPVLLPCLVVFGLFGGMAAFAPSFTWLLVARFGQGIGSAGLINLANIIIGDHWDGLERARVFGYNSAVLTVSLAVLPGIGGLLTDLGGWRLAFAPYPLALVTAVAVARTLHDGPRGEPVTVAQQLRLAGAGLRDRRLVASLGLAFVAFVLIFGLFLTTLPLHLEREFGLSASVRGLVIAVPAIGATLAALALGRLRTRVGPRLLITVAFALFALAFPVVGLAGALVVVLVAALVYGVAEGLVLPTLTDVVAGMAPPDSRGAVLSVQVSAIRAGQSAGPLLAGVGIGLLGTGGTFVAGGAVALVVAAVVGLGGARLAAGRAAVAAGPAPAAPAPATE